MLDDEQLAYVEHETGLVWVTFPYNSDLIAELKMRVGASDRTYDPVGKRWGFNPNRWDYVKRIIKQYGIVPIE